MRVLLAKTMTYNPAIHHRRSIRLKGYDYSSPGAYFITICLQDKKRHLFGEIQHGNMILTPFGEIVQTQWQDIPKRFSNVKIDEYVVMPNHIHVIFHIEKNEMSRDVGASLAVAPTSRARRPDTMAPARGASTVGEIIGAYKSLCVHECLQWIKSKDPQFVLGPFWQRNYWEHIVRNEKELNRIRLYTRNNPLRWKKDSFYGQNAIPDNKINVTTAFGHQIPVAVRNKVIDPFINDILKTKI